MNASYELMGRRFPNFTQLNNFVESELAEKPSESDIAKSERLVKAGKVLDYVRTGYMAKSPYARDHLAQVLSTVVKHADEQIASDAISFIAHNMGRKVRTSENAYYLRALEHAARFPSLHDRIADISFSRLITQRVRLGKWPELFKTVTGEKFYEKLLSMAIAHFPAPEADEGAHLPPFHGGKGAGAKPAIKLRSGKQMDRVPNIIIRMLAPAIHLPEHKPVAFPYLEGWLPHMEGTAQRLIIGQVKKLADNPADAPLALEFAGRHFSTVRSRGLSTAPIIENVAVHAEHIPAALEFIRENYTGGKKRDKTAFIRALAGVELRGFWAKAYPIAEALRIQRATIELSMERIKRGRNPPDTTL